MDDGSKANDADQLRSLGLLLAPEEVRLERRGDRTVVFIPEDRIAWLTTTPASSASLRKENRVLGLVGARCSFSVPAVLAETDDGCTLRTMVPGRVDPEGFAARLKNEPALIPKAGEALAGILAQQHTRIVEADVAGWLQTAPTWPLPSPKIEDQLPRVIDEPDLKVRIGRLLATYENLGTQPHDRALIHGDFGLHNVAFDLEAGTINGVFDYGSAAWADRHLDFRYLVFDAVPDALLDATMAAYVDLTGIAIDRHRVLVCNAAAAVSHLADRAGHEPDEFVAGRTLAADLRWTRWALGRAGF